jgi:hypothetical protein
MMKAINKSLMTDFSHISKNHRWYIAGFLDGEGYMGLIRVNAKNKKGSISPYYYYPVVKVLNTNKEVIDFIEEKLGGYKFFHTRRELTKGDKNYKCRDAYSLEWKSQLRILPFLEWLYPCLIVKKPICEELIHFIKWQMNQNKVRTVRSQFRKERMYSVGELEKKNEFYQKCLLLNHKGAAVTTK